MNARVLIGETGIGGGINEEHTFPNLNALYDFLKTRVPTVITDDNWLEIASSPDTQFEVSEMINHSEQNCAYWGRQRYEITITR